jgi:hypothetical protein
VRFSLWLLLASLALPARASAQTFEMETAKAQGMGGAFRALAFDNSAVDMNPAGLAQVKKVEFTPGYWRATKGSEYAMQVSLTDSLTNASGTGFSYEYRKLRPGPNGESGVESQRYTLAASYPVVPQIAYIGMSTKYFKVDYTDPAKHNKSGYTTDIGMLYRPFQYVAFGAVFVNFINGNQAEAPRSVTGGVAITPAEWFTATGDVFSDLATTNQEKTGWALGAQLAPVQYIAFRGGLYKEALTGNQFWTAGLGLNAETGTFDIAARIPDGSSKQGGSKVISYFATISFLVF